MFATNFEVRRINDAGASSPGDYFLSFSFADLEIVIEEPSWIDRHAFPAFADILNREIREFDLLTRRYFTRVPYEAFCWDAACPQLTGPAKANKPLSRKMRLELFVTFRKFVSSSGMTAATRRS